jgi:hypothetical protein
LHKAIPHSEIAGYLDEHCNVTPRWTVTLGLRCEIEQPLKHVRHSSQERTFPDALDELNFPADRPQGACSLLPVSSATP